MKSRVCIILTLLLAAAFLAAPAMASVDSNSELVLKTKKVKVKKWSYGFKRFNVRHKPGGDGVLQITKGEKSNMLNWGFVIVNRQFISLKHFFRNDDPEMEREIHLRKGKNRVYVFIKGKRGYYHHKNKKKHRRHYYRSRGASIEVAIKADGVAPPPEVSFSVRPQATMMAMASTAGSESNALSIERGQSCVLQWTSKNVVFMNIVPGVGDITGEAIASGNRVVKPSETTSYVLTASGRGDKTIEKTVTVNVTAPPPVVSMFTATPQDINLGQAFTLAWSAANADHCIIQPGDMSVSASGNQDMTPTNAGTLEYTVTAIGEDGRQSDPATVSVTVTDVPSKIFTLAENIVSPNLQNPGAPWSMAKDSNGNVYVIVNDYILRLEGDGTATEVHQGGFPQGIVFDANDNLYVADNYNNSILKATPGNNYTDMATFRGNTDGIAYPSNLVFGSCDPANPADPGCLYVTNLNDDFGPNGYVLKVPLDDSTPTTVAGGFNYPVGLAFDNTGKMYVATWNDNIVWVVDLVNSIGPSTFLGDTVALGMPTGIAVDRAGNVYVSDYANHIIRKVDPTGMVSTFAGFLDSTAPIGASDGNICVVADPSAPAEGPVYPDARFSYPAGLFVDVDDNLYIVDSNNNRIRVVGKNYDSNSCP